MSDPPFKIRKYENSWCVSQQIEMNGHVVWGYVGAFKTWAVAMAVAQVEAGTDGYPYFKEDK